MLETYFKTYLPWLVVLLLAGIALSYLYPVLFPFLIGFVLAYSAHPIVLFFEKYKIPRALGALFGLGLFLFLFTLSIFTIVPMIVYELGRIQAQLPAYAEQFDHQLIELGKQITIGSVKVFDLESTRNFFLSGKFNFEGNLVKLANWLFVSAGGVFGFFFNLLFGFVIAFHFLLGWNRIIMFCHNAIPPRWRDGVMEIVKEFDSVLSGFFRGTVTVVFALTIYYSISFLCVRFDFPFALSLFVSLSTLLPYIGPVLAFTVVVGMALLQGAVFWPVIVIMIVGNLLESFLLTPFIVGGKVGLAPVGVMFFMIFFGYFLGIFGVLVAIPLGGIISIVMRRMYVAWINSAVYSNR